MDNKFTLSSILLALSVCQTATADEYNPKPAKESPILMEKVVVTGEAIGPETSVKHDISETEIKSKLSQVTDTAKLLEDIPGVSLQTNGGVTALPVIHGLNDDRVKTEIDGMIIPSACPNHMNPPLSFVDRSNIGSITVLKGVTPVSMGGDSIGGTITVETPTPVFAKPDKRGLFDGRASSFYRNNGDIYGGNIALGVASQHARLDYTGASTQSRNYQDGIGDVVRSTEYKNQNHAAGLAFNFDNHLLEIKGGQEHVPFQAYPNARMEMTRNDAIFGNVHYRGGFDWGHLDGRLYLENASHEMDAGPDQTKNPNPNMPMDTRAKNFGYKLQAEILADEQNKIRVGNEFHSQELDDFWPPVFWNGYKPGDFCFDMCPNSLINLNNATRDRLGTFAEWQSTWSPVWKSMLGLRYDHTMTDTGNVHGYNTLAWYSQDANAFNRQSHQRNYDTFDVTALMQLTPNDWSQYEFGYARKNRAPSLYELYTWSTWSMATTMIGWFGDGNGYTGNMQLKPETAHNISFTAEYYDPKASAWNIKATPYFSYVENFIDADPCNQGFCGPRFQPTNGFAYLQTANHDARLWGVDVSGNADLFESDAGRFSMHSFMSYVRGERMDGGNLYHMMPLNLKLGLDHQLLGWKSTLETQFVDGKQDVQAIRHELQTPSYMLLNVKTGYQWKNVSIDAGVDNLLDKQYFHPMGGSYIGDYYTMMLNSTKYPNNRAVPGMGRSVYVGLTVSWGGEW